MMKYSFKDKHELSLSQLRELAEVDNAIPCEFDPTHIPDEKMLAGRVEYYSKICPSDFFKVVYDRHKLIGFHIVCGTAVDSGRILTLWVHPDYRSQGLARLQKY